MGGGPCVGGVSRCTTTLSVVSSVGECVQVRTDVPQSHDTVAEQFRGPWLHWQEVTRSEAAGAEPVSERAGEYEVTSVRWEGE